MKQVLIVLVLAAALAGGVFFLWSPGRHDISVATMPVANHMLPVPNSSMTDDALPARAVLDISVRTLDELHVLLDRAEQLATGLRGTDEVASVVLVLHGPEVEFFSSKNYQQYRDVVDQAARLDALDIVDVKICQTMMSIQGIARDDIPAFIDQVPDGRIEVERLQNEGYVYF